jgi:glucose-6-phosphate 1-dehydrogenase
MKRKNPLEPTIFVIFGGAGDLAWRKLVPALFNLFHDERMPADFSIIAVGRSDVSEEKLRRRFFDGVKKFSRLGKVKTGEWIKFAGHLHYLKGDFYKRQTYLALGEQCLKLE